MPTALILGARAPAALDCARRFAAHGWRAQVADSAPCRLSGGSRAVQAAHRLAPPRQAPRAFAADLARIVREQRVDLLMPTCEEAFYLSRYRSALPAGLRVLVDEFDTLRALHSKLAFLELARGCGARVPDSAAVRDLAQAREWAAGAPLVLKPEFSRFGVHVRLYPHGLPDTAPALAPGRTWVAQRFHAGTELCSYSVAERGRLLAHALYRPAYRLRRSASFYFEPAACAPILDFAARLVAKIGYTGQISFDWILGEDGVPTVLECNPRATSGLHLFAAGDDLPAALAGQGEACLQPSGERPRMIAAVMAGAGLAQALRQGALAQWRRDWRRAEDVIAPAGDRAPLWGGLADVAAYAGRSLARGGRMREATTGDIEWDGEDLPAP